MLCNELVGHGMAGLLGIRHATCGLVDVPAAAMPHDGKLLVTDDDGDPVTLLPGIHFYSKWLEPADDLKPEDLTLAGMTADVGMLAGVAVLDTLLGQWDRKPLNPNLLLVRQAGRSNLYLMDLGMAFGSAIWGINELDPLQRPLPEINGPLPYSWPPADLFAAVRVPQDFAPYLEAVTRVTRQQITDLVATIPDEWTVTDEERAALVNYLHNRAVALPAYFEARFQRPDREWWE